MSKYEKLLQSLRCRWSSGSGYECGEEFSNACTLTEHLRRRHIPSVGGSQWEVEEGVFECGWEGCGQVILGSHRSYVLHVLGHPYHCFLKLRGSELQVKMKLPDCQYESKFCDVVQPLEVEPRCLWEGGTCQEVFDDVWGFFSHVRAHVKKAEGVTCSWGDCKFVGRDRNKVQDHVRTHMQEKQVACPTCGKQFCNNTKLKDHLNRQLDPPRDPAMTCRYCRKKFPNERLLREHTRKHVNSVRCPHCGLTCQSPSRLHQHVRSRHVENKSHQCPLCHKTYKTVQSLSLHIESHGEYRATCKHPKCNFLAKSEKILKAHEHDVHFSEEDARFCCHVCGATYPLGRMLSVHLKKVHGFKLPPGHCRFRYVLSEDGFKRLQTVRLDDENVYTPELNTFIPSSCSDDSTFSHTHHSVAPGSSVVECGHSQDSLEGESGTQKATKSSLSVPDFLSSLSDQSLSALFGSDKSPSPEAPPMPLPGVMSGVISHHTPPVSAPFGSNKCPPSGSSLPDFPSGVNSDRNAFPLSAVFSSNKSPPPNSSPSFLSPTFTATSSSFSPPPPASCFHTPEKGGIEASHSFSSIFSSPGPSEGILTSASFDAIMAHFSSIDPDTPIPLNFGSP